MLDKSLVQSLSSEERKALLQEIVKASYKKTVHRTPSKAGNPDLKPYNPYALLSISWARKPTQLKTTGVPEDYYCGVCARRLLTSQELESHARTSHPHASFFGQWPRETSVAQAPSAGTAELLEALGAEDREKLLLALERIKLD